MEQRVEPWTPPNKLIRNTDHQPGRLPRDAGMFTGLFTGMFTGPTTSTSVITPVAGIDLIMTMVPLDPVSKPGFSVIRCASTQAGCPGITSRGCKSTAPLQKHKSGRTMVTVYARPTSSPRRETACSLVKPSPTIRCKRSAAILACSGLIVSDTFTYNGHLLLSGSYRKMYDLRVAYITLNRPNSGCSCQHCSQIATKIEKLGATKIEAIENVCLPSVLPNTETK